MSKYSSKLGEEVYLTEEELVEMKLSGEHWTIFLSPHDDPFLDIIGRLSSTTNLLKKCPKSAFLTTAKNKYQKLYPIVDILGVDINDGRLLWKLHKTEHYHIPITKQD